jgi:hypothetical protein
LRKRLNGVGGLGLPVAPPIGASRGFFTTLPDALGAVEADEAPGVGAATGEESPAWETPRTRRIGYTFIDVAALHTLLVDGAVLPRNLVGAAMEAKPSMTRSDPPSS